MHAVFSTNYSTCYLGLDPPPLFARLLLNVVLDGGAEPPVRPSMPRLRRLFRASISPSSLAGSDRARLSNVQRDVSVRFTTTGTGDNVMTTSDRPAFYTVREAAALLRVGPSTLYRSIRENSFPAVRLRTRYVVPSKVIDQLIEEVVNGGGCVDVGQILSNRRQQADFRRQHPEWT